MSESHSLKASMDQKSTAVLRVSPLAGAAEDLVALFSEMDIAGLGNHFGKEMVVGWGIRG